jgi:hypothetical protein
MRTLRVGVVLALGLTLGACSGDVLESDEYTELSAEAEGLRADLAAAEVRAEEAAAETAGTETSLAEAETALAEAETALAAAEVRAEEAEAAAAASAEPQGWPVDVKNSFIEGCTQDTEDGFTDQQREQFCTCITDELEATVSLDEFIVLALSVADPSTPVSPLTGLPVGLDDDFAEAFVDSATSCLLAVE